MKPRLTFKVMNGLIEMNRLLAKALVELPPERAAEEIAVARRWIRSMDKWWDERDQEVAR